MKLRLEAKTFANQGVLAPLELELSPGEFVTLTGASGSGKTTLLRIIAGLDCDWSGSLDYGELAPVGFMFQEPRLMPWLSVLENLYLVGADRPTATDLLEQVGLVDSQHKFPGQLSGGMQRRVALARVLVMKPRLLLLDEPFASLDAVNAEACRQLLLECWRETGTTVLLVTHNQGEAEELGQRQLTLVGQPAELVVRV